MDMGMDQKGMDHKGTGHRLSSGRVRGPARQRGSVLALVAVGMLAIIGMAGLALQSGHLFVNKTHLQNALDAAALSAAKTLNNDGTVVQATAAGQAAFQEHVAPATGDSTFLERQLRDSSYTLTFAFSATLVPFVGGALETDDPPATFVRAAATGVSMDTWLVNVLPGVGDKQSIGGTAVAGPAPIDPTKTCDVLPLVMCAQTPTDPDKDCSDGECFGWTSVNNEVSSTVRPGESTVRPGESYILGLGGLGVGEALAGGYSGCVTVGATAAPEPGVAPGPVQIGVNTRFGEQVGLPQADYPADTVTTQATPGPPGICTGFCYEQYVASQHNEAYDNPPPAGVPDRRKVAVPIGDCTDLPAGATPPVPVIGIGCFFLTRKAGTGVYGQLVGECEADGNIAAGPPGGPHKIVLYKDPGSPDS